ncbi:MAG: hypothetical protein RL373_1194 [Pseudomonadota bacterium]|jgi:4-hydroxy-tetrahydrodipicolinate synthase|nr:dihydrodipicolinate synthase family protein [Betaproteobacteria bacterium]
MSVFTPGLVHTPVTPFTTDLKIDYSRYEQLLEFHLAQGAQSLAITMHAGESVSLTDQEQRAQFAFATKQVNGRVPLLAHVSDSGTRIALERAQYAESIGMQAVICTTPYYWTPPAPMILEHFLQVSQAVKLPFFVFYSPDEMGGITLSTDLILKLVDQRPNFAGMIDASLDWQFMINIISNVWRKKPEFQLLAGNEYMVSAGAIGATSMLSGLGAIAPKLIKELYTICRTEKYVQARQAQENVAALLFLITQYGFGGLKSAMYAMGRDCGIPRPPHDALSPSQHQTLSQSLHALPFMSKEPQGW